MSPKYDIGLCVYAMPYTFGAAAKGTPRANPNPIGYFGFLDLAARLGLSSVEIPVPPLNAPDSPSAEAIRRSAEERRLRIVVSGRRISARTLREDMDFASRLGAKVVRCTLSGVLCGDRSPVGGLKGWRDILSQAGAILTEAAPFAEEEGIRIGVENHQDATSEDLVWLCEKVGSASVGVTLDTGNPLAVCEDPIAFARRVLPHIVNVHLKDYRMFAAPSGFRLAHCPVGAGVIDFAALFRMLTERPEAARNIEMAAHTARHIRILDEDYWEGHEARDMASVLPVLRLWREREETGEWRTPWETGELDKLAAWEMERLKESVQRMAELLASLDAKTEARADE